MNGKQTPQQKSKVDFSYYLHLLMEKKYWIILITVLFSIVWFLILPRILASGKKYNFTAAIRFEDPRVQAQVGTIDERLTQMETESRTRIIQTTSFLNRVIDSLRLNISSATLGVMRSEIFKKIDLQPDMKFGLYIMQKDADQLKLLYTNKPENIKDKLILQKQLSDSGFTVLEANGIKVTVFNDVFNKKDKILFECTPSRFLVQAIRDKLELSLNRRQTLLTISYVHNDPKLGAQIVNTIADLFLQRLLESKRSRTSALLATLEHQLKTSKDEMEKSENALRIFRERNPHIYLTEDLASFNQALTSEEMTRNQINTSLMRLERLLNEKNNAKTRNEQDLIYQEILSFLQEQEIAGITALTQQYQNALTQKQELEERNISEDNARMIEVNKTLSALQKKLDERVKEFKTNQNITLQNLNASINLAERRMRQSPRKELELAKLQRDRKAKSDIYSNLLVRYNEVKIAHVSITADAELLQQAEEPILIPTIKDLIKKIFLVILGPLVGFLLAIGIFLLINMIWHKARSSQDLENALELPVLASVPIIKSDKEIPEEFAGPKRMDPKLVTVDFSPSPASEAIRSVRTRLTLEAGEDQQQGLVLSSLTPGEGKSIIVANLAITFAQLKKPTLLIDTDLRRGVLHNSFMVSKKPGLSDILANKQPLTVENVSQVIQKTTIPNLHIISSGKEVPNPTELIMDKRMEDLIDNLKKHFQYLIFDTAPISMIPDAVVLNKIIHNFVLVVRYGKTDVNKLKKQMKQFPDVRKDIRGVILNATKNSGMKGYHSYSYYKY